MKLLSLLSVLTLVFSPSLAIGLEEVSLQTPVTLPADTIIVKLKSHIDVETAAAESVAGNAGTAVDDVLAEENIAIVRPERRSIREAIASLNNDPRVEYAEPNFRRDVTAIPTNDTHRGLLWGFDNTGSNLSAYTISGTPDADIDLPEAWAISQGTADVVVAIIDTGVYYTHPDLTSSMWEGTSCRDENGNPIGGCMHGYDFADNDKDPLPAATEESSWHGTHVAGTVGATSNNGIGVTGVTPHVKIMALRFGLDVASEVRAIDFARHNGAKIINASYSGSGFSQAEYDAIKRFTDGGGIFVAAAGNAQQGKSATNNDVQPLYPASHQIPNSIAVAATDENDQLASFSNYGVSSVDIASPGTNIASTYFEYVHGALRYTYAFADGTSMASPMTAGVLALLLSYNPSLSASQAAGILLASGDSLSSLSGKVLSGKRTNAARALATFSPRVGLTTDDTIPLYALQNSSTTLTISLKVRDGIDNLPVSITSFEYSTGGEWKDAQSALGKNTLSTAVDFSGATSTLAVDLGKLAATSTVSFRMRVFDGATTSPYATTETLSLIQEGPVAGLLDLPHLTDTSAVPFLNALVSNVVAYKFKLDAGSWSPERDVAERISEQNLLNGTHTISVIGKDAIGVWQSEASSTNYAWLVNDTTAPSLSGLAENTTPAQSSTWIWSADDSFARFRFLVTDATSTATSTLSAYGNATTTSITGGDGVRYLYIQAIDSNGNETPVYSFSALLDNTAPVASVSGPAASSTSTTALFTIGGTDVTSFKYRVDGGAWSATTALSTPVTVTGLIDGDHLFEAVASDLAGNWQSTASSTAYRWNVTVPPPAPAPAPAHGGGGGGGSSAGSTGGGGGGGGTAPQIPSTIKGDTNGDGRVDLTDFNTLMIDWGSAPGSKADINSDGVVDLLDFNSIMINWSV